MDKVTVNFSLEIAITFIAYSGLMLGIGFYFYKKNKDMEDYFLGGRSMGPVISALSAGASDMSGWLLMGLPGALFVSGLVDSYIAIGLSIGALLNWSFVAKRLRIYTGVIAKSITIPDYFETRFDDDKHILRIICAIVILVFFTVYVSSGLVGGAKLFESTFGIDYSAALLTGTAIIVIYTFLGGYKAVCWTDMIQGFLMMFALIIVPIIMAIHLGGYDSAMQKVLALKPNALNMTKDISIISIISAMAWGLGYFGQPHILVRFMSIRSTKDIPSATVVGISWMVISLIGACFVGLFGIAYIDSLGMVDFKDSEKIFIFAAQKLFNPWVAGILLSAILAAIMSTASSQLLVSSSTLAEDFYKIIFNKEPDPKVTLRLSRAGVLLVAIIAFYMSYDNNAKILDIVAYAWAGFGASFGSVMLFSLFWGKMTRLAAIVGMVAGASTVIIYKELIDPHLSFHIYEIIPGFLVASILIIIISKLTTVREGTKKAYDTMLKHL